MPGDNIKLCYKKHSLGQQAEYTSTSNFVLALDSQVERLIEKSFLWAEALLHVSLHLSYYWIVFPCPRTWISLETDCISFIFVSSVPVIYVSSSNSLHWLVKNHTPSIFSTFFQNLALSVFFSTTFLLRKLKMTIVTNPSTSFWILISPLSFLMFQVTFAVYSILHCREQDRYIQGGFMITLAWMSH